MHPNLDTIRNYCLSKIGATESLPFGPDTLVFKVGGKMFAAADLKEGYTLNLKCNPELAVELRERHAEITPGYHMNKKHWNTLHLNGTLPLKLIFELIDHSYQLVFQSLNKQVRQQINIDHT